MSPRRPSAGVRLLQPLAAVLLVAGMVLGLPVGPVAASSSRGLAPSEPATDPAIDTVDTVDIVELSGVIDQTLATYVTATIAEAEREGSRLVLVQLDTPGGLGTSMDQIVEAILSSGSPVVVWVGPEGASATSAGMFIASAAPVLAMAPGTRIGAATPVDLGGDELSAKARNDAEARLAGLAERWGRNSAFARAAVRDGAVALVTHGGRRVPGGTPAPVLEGSEGRPAADGDDVIILDAQSAVDQGIADLVAASLPDVLRELDGHRLDGAEGSDGATAPRTLDLDPAAVTIRFHTLGLIQRLLHAVANPTLAYLLLVGGALALLFELFQPGFGVAGVSGVVLFGLGLYGLSVLPVNWLAFGLLLLGLVLLAVDLAVAGLGALTLGGTLALAVGSFLLFGGSPLLRPSPWLVVAVVLGALAFFVVVMTTVLRAQGTPSMTGSQALLGQVGVVRSMLNPEGHVFVGGALWRARAPEVVGSVRTGARVRVVGVRDGLTLEVQLLDAGEPIRETARG
jgi:membrane-bound serine protease (ClpP class)